MKYVFVHGVGKHPDLRDWRQPMIRHLSAAGISPPPLDGPDWIEIDYQDLLDAEAELAPPDWPARPAVPAAATQAYAERNAALRQIVREPPTNGAYKLIATGAEKAASLVTGVPESLTEGKLEVLALAVIKDAKLFAQSRDRQCAIVNRLLEALPSGEIVVVAHSLGSVAMLAALPFLEIGTTVRQLITIGSPLALDALSGATDLAGRDGGAAFPADRVHSWLNLVDCRDAITSGAGLRGDYSFVIDHRVRNALVSDGIFTVHSAWAYLDQDIIGEALALSLSAN